MPATFYQKASYIESRGFKMPPLPSNVTEWVITHETGIALRTDPNCENRALGEPKIKEALTTPILETLFSEFA